MICIDCRYVRERPSGIGLVVRELIDRLPKWMADERFLLLRHPLAPRLSPEPNVREVVVPQEANGPATMWWLPRVVDLRDVELFHAPFNILPAGLRMSTLVTMHDVMWLTNPEWAQSPGAWGHVERWFYRHGIRRALRKADHLVAISEATQRAIASLDPNAARRSTVLLQGTPSQYGPDLDDEDRERTRRACARLLPAADRFVLTVGQFVGYKNHATVVRAFARAFADEADVHLALVQRLGRGSKVLQPLAEELGVGDRVHFLSGVAADDLARLYRGAICLCHPSLVEGFGLPLAEAMASGCAVVTSDRSSMPEVCGDAATYVDPTRDGDVANALREVATDSARSAMMRQRGLSRAQALTWDRYARGHEQLYRRLLDHWRSERTFLTKP